MQRSFILLKPDGVQAALTEPTQEWLTAHGLRIIQSTPLEIGESRLSGIYGKYSPQLRPFTAENFKCYFLGRTCHFIGVEGVDAVARTTELKAELRQLHGSSILGNVAHTPDPHEVDEQWPWLTEDVAEQPGAFTCNLDEWGIWTLPEIQEAVREVWEEVFWPTTHWYPHLTTPPSAGPQWSLTFPPNWDTPLDQIILGLATWTTSYSAAEAFRGALDAIYAPGGYRLAHDGYDTVTALNRTAHRLGGRLEQLTPEEPHHDQ